MQVKSASTENVTAAELFSEGTWNQCPNDVLTLMKKIYTTDIITYVRAVRKYIDTLKYCDI